MFRHLIQLLVLKLSRRQNSMKCSRPDNCTKMWRFADIAGHDPSPSSGFCWWVGRTKTENWVSYPVLCISLLGLGAGWNVTTLVSGSRQEVNALGLGCLLLKCSTQPAIDSPGQVPWTLDYSHQPDRSQSNLRPGPTDIYTTQGRTPIYQFQFCHTASNILIMGTESDTVMLDNLHILMWLSAWECFIEFNTVILALQKQYLKIIIPDYITYAHTHWIAHVKLQNANIIFFYSH